MAFTISSVLLAFAAALPLASATVTSQFSLSGNYTPTVIPCPANQTYIRPASSGLSASEQSWLSLRRPNVANALEAYLNNVAIPGFNVSAYISALKANNSLVPIIGMTMSGGGNRAELGAYGVYQALDARYPPAWSSQTGGLVQAMTYTTSLSGGTIANTALGVNGYPDLQTLIANNNFNFSISPEALEQVAGKAELGYPITVSDIYGISSTFYGARSVFDQSIDALGFTWSGVQVQPSFANGSTPMPILMTDEVIPYGLQGSLSWDTINGTILYPSNASQTYYELTPFEFGSWRGRVKAFLDIEYFGTPMSGGLPINASVCINGYDSAAFCAGAGFAAANLWLAESTTDGVLGQFAKRSKRSKIPYPPNEDKLEQERVRAQLLPNVKELGGIEELLKENLTTILYGYTPNPFYGMNTSAIDPVAASQEELLLVDGSETGQVNPLWPVIQPERALDFIVVSDACGSELSSGWMNGTNFHNTYISAKATGLPFPTIPPVVTMLNLNHTSRPVFYGCNEPDVPLILFLADFPYTAYTNISGLQSTITNNQVELLTLNSLSLVTQANNTLRSDWSTCIACGALQRSLKRSGMAEPESCSQCWKEYCWQGNLDQSQPGFLEPSLVLNSTLSWAEWNATVLF
ncbi:hypothetical protein FRB96_002522 [Tulasnella sp. 330]|nr:hypothetical protein FRB96_002522 [Tulasnella sp. 330]KAG8885730.1 hypothetical protein FRB98_001642 [Tulasnella sp. 332]